MKKLILIILTIINCFASEYNYHGYIIEQNEIAYKEGDYITFKEKTNVFLDNFFVKEYIDNNITKDTKEYINMYGKNLYTYVLKKNNKCRILNIETYKDKKIILIEIF